MKYQPALPAHNDNVSPQHPLKDVFVILGGLLAICALVFWLLGLAVDAVVDGMSPQSEARLYSLLPDSTFRTPDRAASRRDQLQAMVDGMRSCAGLAQPLRVTLAEVAQPNALVLPGGQMVVYSGLLNDVKSENGLAFVLAHEMAHIAHRDHLRSLGRGIVAFGLSALVTGSDSGLTQMLAPAGQMGVAHHSRRRESAADAAALRILACRYGHVGGATELFAALSGEDRERVALSHYMASHPDMGERIGAINAAIRQAGMQTRAVLPLNVRPLD